MGKNNITLEQALTGTSNGTSNSTFEEELRMFRLFIDSKNDDEKQKKYTENLQNRTIEAFLSSPDIVNNRYGDLSSIFERYFKNLKKIIKQINHPSPGPAKLDEIYENFIINLLPLYNFIKNITKSYIKFADIKSGYVEADTLTPITSGLIKKLGIKEITAAEYITLEEESYKILSTINDKFGNAFNGEQYYSVTCTVACLNTIIPETTTNPDDADWMMIKP